jgi:hypothetical protein
MATATLTKTETVQIRFTNALKAIRKDGIATRMNVMSCCGGCADIPESEHKPVIWTFGGQGGAFSYIDGVMVYRDVLAKVKRRGYGITAETVAANKGKVTKVYINHTSVESARIAATAFHVEGFDVEWDGTDMNCVVVIIP